MRRIFPCLVLVAALSVSGCGWFSSNEIDWQSRVGSYTYEDAVKDYGEPLACQDFSDGGQSCTWSASGVITRERNMVLTFDGYGYLESKDMMSF